MLKTYIQKELEVAIDCLPLATRMKANFVIKDGNKNTVVEVDFKEDPPHIIFHLSGIKETFKSNIKEIINIGLAKIHD